MKPALPALALLAFAAAAPAYAVPTRDAHVLEKTSLVGDITNEKEFYVNYADGQEPWKELEVFVVVREVEDEARKGWYDFKFIGRAAVAESSSAAAHMVLYKSFHGQRMQPGDHLVATGDPLTLDEMDMLRKEVLGVLHRDAELEDLYAGLISFKAGFYWASLNETSAIQGSTDVNDTNSYKKSASFFMYSFGVRWWFTFQPSFGLNVDFSSGYIPTYGFHSEAESSQQTNVNPGLVYRSRLLVLPAIYSLTYFFNSFQTTNPDDFLISSIYSGPDLNVSFYYPYRVKLLRVGPVTMYLTDAEAGVGYAPFLAVTDNGAFKRGTNGNGSMLNFGGGVEFNIDVRRLRFTNNLFFILEGGQQRFNLSFSGATTGTLPDGTAIPENGQHSEVQTWFGLRVKYNIKDIIGEMISGM